jgi:drug/metabolite transporter (DMT)-like permease
MHPVKSWQVFGVLGLGVLAMSTAAIFVRFATETISQKSVGFSLVMAASRLIIAALILSPRWLWFKPASVKSIYFSILSGLLLAIHFATWISSLSYTSITASTTLVTTTPIWVALLSWIWFKESLSRRAIVGIAIALFGGIVISSDGSSDLASHPVLGNALALVGSWAASLYLLLGREAQRYGLNTGNHILIAYSVAAITLLPMPLIAGASYTHYPGMTYLWFALMALVPQLIGHTSFNWAVNHLPATIVTLAILMEPIGASLLGYLLFAEVPSFQICWGAVVLLVGVAIAILKPSVTTDEATADEAGS